jgi:FixJ family two-component response regulator
MDGLAVVHEAQRRRAGLPAILLTGFSNDAVEVAMGGAVSGTFSLLRKPVTAQQLAERVTVLLEAAARDATRPGRSGAGSHWQPPARSLRGS